MLRLPPMNCRESFQAIDHCVALDRLAAMVAIAVAKRSANIRPRIEALPKKPGCRGFSWWRLKTAAFSKKRIPHAELGLFRQREPYLLNRPA
jgi:hypothetical protein